LQNILDNTKLEGRPSAAALAALLGLTPSYVLHYPGYLAYDSLRFLAEGRQLAFLSQHQPFVGFVWHFLDRLVEGAPLMLLFQVAPFWLAVYLLLHYLKVAWPLAIAAVLLLIFWPTLLLLSGVIFKDTIARNFIILAFVLLLERPAGKRMLFRRGLSGAAPGIACQCRYQYAVVLLPVLAGLMLQRPDAAGSSPRKFPLGASLVASFLVTIVGVNSLIASVSTVSTDNLGANLQRLIIYDLAGIAVREPEGEKVLNSAGIDADKVKRMLLENYQAQRVDPIIYDALALLRKSPVAATSSRIQQVAGNNAHSHDLA
jgi:hypothetical protein